MNIFISIILFSCVINFAKITPSHEYKQVSLSTKLEEEGKLVQKLYEDNNDSSNVINFLPKAFVSDGSIDYTQNIQSALDALDTIVLPNFPIAINYKGVNLASGKKLVFQEGSALLMIPNNKESYQMISVENAKNVEIVNPVLVGDRTKHVGRTGEWGMGIKILSSEYVRILSPNISECWGDAIYIGGHVKGMRYSKEVQIIGGLLKNNRRNGISIISVDGLLVKNIRIEDTKGTLPEAGLDIEPNNNLETLKGIVIEDLVTVNNRRGILIALNNFRKGNKHKEVDIQVSNHRDEASRFALGLALGGRSSKSPISGLVTINDAFWSSNQEPIQYYELYKAELNLNINNLVLDKQKKNLEDIQMIYRKYRTFKIN